MFFVSDIFQEALRRTKLYEQKTVNIQVDYIPLPYILVFLPVSALKCLDENLRLKSFVFWDTLPYSSLKLNRRFGGTCRLYLENGRISQARKQCESGWQDLHNHHYEKFKS
jgi:hypothetical protein